MMNRDPQTHEIIGAAMEVHGKMGFGFLEAVYQEILGIEMTDRRIPFVNEVELPITYKGNRINTTYRADFICYEEIVVELKAISNLTSNDDAQLLNYLKATGFHRGILLNFGARSLEFKRLVFGYPSSR